MNYPYYYQPMYQPPQPPAQAASMKDERTWVQGEAGAKGFMVVPGTTVALWDSEQPVIWLKSVNFAGIPTMQRIPYTIEAGASGDIENRLAGIERRLAALEPKEVTPNE